MSRTDDTESKPRSIADEIREEKLDCQDKTEASEKREPKDGLQEPELGSPVTGAMVDMYSSKLLGISAGL